MQTDGLKIAVIGGGSSYTPEIIDGLIRLAQELPVAQIHLIDILLGQEKLKIVGALAERMIAKAGLNTKIYLTLDRRQGLKDADFVISQIRVGGLSARIHDERFPLKYHILGQETTGPGGFANALRTIPVVLDICRDMEDVCPSAWLINFTNPSGLITEMILRHTQVKCIGLCNVPINMVMTVAKIMEAKKEDVHIDFAGLNHLVWGLKVWCKGQDVTQEVLTRLQDSTLLNMNNIPNLKWDGSFIKALGYLPCPYHRYYYMTDRILQEELAAIAPGGPGTRAEQVQEVESRLFDLYQDVELAQKPKELEKRGGAYYSEAAVSLISAIYNDKREVHTVDIANQGAIFGLADDSVVEINCIIGKNGAEPLPIGKLPPEITGLVQQVKSYEVLAIEAGVKGDRDKALLAMVCHPLVPSVAVAKEVLEELLVINADYLPQFQE